MRNPNSNFTKAKFEEVVEAVKANNGYIIDTHNHSRTPYRAAGVAALVKGDKVTPVLLCHGSYFCVNPLHKEDDGTVSLSSWSVGGTIFTHQHGGLVEAIEAYNVDQDNNPFSSGRIEEVHLISNDDNV